MLKVNPWSRSKLRTPPQSPDKFWRSLNGPSYGGGAGGVGGVSVGHGQPVISCSAPSDPAVPDWGGMGAGGNAVVPGGVACESVFGVWIATVFCAITRAPHKTTTATANRLNRSVFMNTSLPKTPSLVWRGSPTSFHKRSNRDIGKYRKIESAGSADFLL